MKPKVKPIKDPEFYADYLFSHDRCESCWGRDSLSRHHIIRFGRSDEWSNVILLCWKCHDLAHGKTIRNTDTGEEYPTITLGQMLMIKYLTTEKVGQFDYERLQELYGQTIPSLEPIPEWLLEERSRNKRKR